MEFEGRTVDNVDGEELRRDINAHLMDISPFY
ncbi:MAG: hypothetical protein ACI8Q1_001965 [Parvicella sp.]|jgi:hypothetical protein